MAKLNAKRAMEDFKGSNNDFFKLENDMDCATVRFLYDNEEELDIYAVHEIDLNGKKRYIECLQSGDCPMCQESSENKELKVKVKFFLQLEDEDGKVKTWERGQLFIPKILGMFNKYGQLCNRLYEIERHGKPKDTKTTYELYALDKDDMTLDELPEKQDLLGDFVLEWSSDKMNAWLDGEDVTANDEPTPEPPTQRRNNSREQAKPQAQSRGGSARGASTPQSTQRTGRGAKQEPVQEQAPKGRASSRGGESQTPAPRKTKEVTGEDVF